MSGSLTAEEIIASNPLPGFVASVLADELRLGRLIETDGRWQATPALVARYANAFSYLGPSRPATERRQP